MAKKTTSPKPKSGNAGKSSNSKNTKTGTSRNKGARTGTRPKKDSN